MAEKAEKAEKKRASASGSGQDVSLSVSDIKELFGLMKENEIAELNLEQRGTKIRIISTHAPIPAQQAMQPMMPMMQGVAPMGMMNVGGASHAQAQASAATPAAAPAPAPSAAPSAEPTAPANVKTINSPMVGTFYRSPAPEAPSFVQVGDMVTDDTTLCIIEAMKLMNELKAETKGRVYKILVENGQPVEYNQPLFLIEPA
jgi:oxaloacetate decarboxylase (Na+ extruding) subunit alpha